MSRLDGILKCGAIFSRNYQELMLSELGLEQNKYAKIIWNGEDYISICRKQGNKPDRTSEAFYEFVESGISIILIAEHLMMQSLELIRFRREKSILKIVFHLAILKVFLFYL